MSPEEKEEHVARMMKDILLRTQTSTEARLMSIGLGRVYEFRRLSQHQVALTTRNVVLSREATRLWDAKSLLGDRRYHLLDRYIDHQDMQCAKLLQELRDKLEHIPDGDLKARVLNAVEDPEHLAEILEIPTQREHEPATIPDDIGLVIQLAEILAEECVMDCRIEANQVVSSEITQAISANKDVWSVSRNASKIAFDIV